MTKRKKITVIELPEEKQYGSMGTAGFICSCIGFWVIPIVFSSLGVILSAIGVQKNEKLANWGLGIGIVGLVFGFYQIMVVLTTFGLI